MHGSDNNKNRGVGMYGEGVYWYLRWAGLYKIENKEHETLYARQGHIKQRFYWEYIDTHKKNMKH